MRGARDLRFPLHFVPGAFGALRMLRDPPMGEGSEIPKKKDTDGRTPSVFFSGP